MPEGKLKTAVAALAYLCDPFDALYDQHPHLGLENDARHIRKAAGTIRRSCVEAGRRYFSRSTPALHAAAS